MSKNKIWYVPEITKVKLNPEQAVLSCCNAFVEGQITKPKVGSSAQCSPSKCGGGLGGDALSS